LEAIKSTMSTPTGAKTFYVAQATAKGGRNGHTQSDDGLVSADLSVPKSMGGPGRPNTTTPEHLFAAGYAACFGGAVEYMGVQMKLRPASVQIDSAVSILGLAAGGFGLAVELHAIVAGLSQEDAEKIVAAGHQLCPYSNAIKGNVEVTIKVTAVAAAETTAASA
jgi:lipoyl-dependent peroxiredoxin